MACGEIAGNAESPDNDECKHIALDSGSVAISNDLMKRFDTVVLVDIACGALVSTVRIKRREKMFAARDMETRDIWIIFVM